MSGLLNQKHALAKLKAELKGRKRKICQCCKKFRYLVHNYRNEKKKVKGKQISQNKFETIVNKVMQYGVREKIEVRRQKVVEEVKCFRCWGVEHYKWECPSIEVERKRHKEVVVHVAIPQKV